MATRREIAAWQKKLNVVRGNRERVDILNHLGFHLRNEKPEQALGYAAQAANYAQSTEYPKGLAQAHYVRSLAYLKLSRFVESLAAAEAAISIYENIADEASVIKVLRAAADAEIMLGMAGKAIGHLNTALAWYDASNKTEHSALIHGIISRCYGLTGDYEQAISHAQQAVEYYHTTGDYDTVAAMYNNIGLSYFYRGDYPNSIRYFMQSLDLRGGYEVGTEAVAGALNNLGLAFSHLGDNTAALDYYLKAETAQGDDDCPTLASILANIGLLRTEMHDYAGAEQSLLRALEVSNRLNYAHGRAVSLLYLGNIRFAMGNTPSARENFSAAATIAEESGDIEVMHSIYNSFGVCALESGDLEYATQLLQQAKNIAERLQSSVKLAQSLVNLAKAMFCRHELTAAFACYHEALSIATTLQNNSIGLEIHYGLTALYKHIGDYQNALKHSELYNAAYSAYHDEKQERQFIAMNAVYEVERNRKDMENYRRRVGQLEMLMEHKSRELSVLSMNLLQRSELLATLKGKIRSLMCHAGTTNAPTEEVLRTLESQLDHIEPADADWKTFDQQLSESQLYFTQLLSRNYPLLTRTELRVCVLVKIMMQTKEIAALLGVKETAVEAHRVNIRKKLGLSTKTNLRDFFTDLDLANIREHSNNHDGQFSQKLKAIYPGITATEIKICSLLRMNLSTREIARTLSISERTVEKHRSNIRKKYGIDEEVNLVMLFNSL